MVFSKTLAVATALTVVSPFVSAFNAESKSNVAVYYGQGYAQPRLSEFCQDPSLDIINIGFINEFPDQDPITHWPASNFGNQCNGEFYEWNGVQTKLLSGCHQLMEDIPICQAAGKKIFLSLGGASPATQKILSHESALAFADFLWASFGPVEESWIEWGGPRPFGNITFDGFDFDIEHNGDFGYADMVNRLREHFAEVPDRTFYISGAPQCALPDAQLSDAITNSPFDFVWVQFYNTPGCSARDYVDGTGFNFDEWIKFIKKSANPNAKLLVGLPASESAAGAGYYLTPTEVKPLVSKYMKKYPQAFGGIMLWEATESKVNQIDGGSYADSSSAPVPSSSTTTSTSSGNTAGPTTASSSTSGNSGATTTSGITSAPVTASSTTAPGSTSEPATITTVIVTSYTSICPTGFTTITTTYTTTYCPGAASATPTATQSPTGPGPHTTAPAPPPEGWTTTVTVCTQCAATPTTVTLTVPCTDTPAHPTTEAVVPTSTATLPEGWTTTVTVCTECGPTPTTVTVTVPITKVETVPAKPTGEAPVAPPAHITMSRPLIYGTGGIRPRPSSTLYVRPSNSGNNAPVAPTSTPEGVSPVFTGAAPRGMGVGHGAVVLIASMLYAFLI
ncbi:hypothetical protein FE257_012742 [Aspergillus nanangensis]|uniref:chitinase n=1 Tax=Aspergillus nanangensis TaxID=2582783 RepID=A0AAD4CFN6_ASPNN|nr:hypothetical protein FE257_012742 [Aspergillus nanangensis]